MLEGCIWGGGFILDPVGSCVWEKNTWKLQWLDVNKRVCPSKQGRESAQKLWGNQGNSFGKRASFTPCFIPSQNMVLGQDSTGATSSRKPSWISPVILTTQGPVFCTTQSSQCEITRLCVITLRTEVVSGRMGSFHLQLSHLKHSSWLKIRALQMLFVVDTGPVFLQQLLHKEGMAWLTPFLSWRTDGETESHGSEARTRSRCLFSVEEGVNTHVSTFLQSPCIKCMEWLM